MINEALELAIVSCSGGAARSGSLQSLEVLLREGQTPLDIATAAVYTVIVGQFTVY
jgi:hypothetical protein